ncbi:MAG: HAMP domain-containing sensor histidine kinase [Actinomycetaceae bacterium]|nr:HAMP domain-containing sensor histidine kinase [Actinomycetaceae bacterium]
MTVILVTSPTALHAFSIIVLGFFAIGATVLTVRAVRRHRSKSIDALSNVDVLAHEIRTPLSLIKGAAELLDAAGPLTSEQQQFANTIKSNSEHVIAIAEDFLTLAKLDASGGALDMRAFDLRAFVRDAAKELRAVNDFPLLLTDSGEPLYITADPTLIKHVLWNLMNNAARHAGPQSQILVRTYKSANMYGIEVRDSGYGIEPSKRDEVFRPFTKADVVSPIATGQGAGLGLAIVQRIVELHEGEVLVDSLWGRGTSIHVLLPKTVPSRQRRRKWLPSH